MKTMLVGLLAALTFAGGAASASSPATSLNPSAVERTAYASGGDYDRGDRDGRNDRGDRDNRGDRAGDNPNNDGRWQNGRHRGEYQGRRPHRVRYVVRCHREWRNHHRVRICHRVRVRW